MNNDPVNTKNLTASNDQGVPDLSEVFAQETGPVSAERALVTIPESRFLDVIIDNGYRRDDVLKIAALEDRPVDEELLTEIVQVVEATRVPLPVVLRATEQGLSLANVEVAYTALATLNEGINKGQGGLKLVSSVDYEGRMLKARFGSEAYEVLAGEDSKHRANCATIDDERLEAFIKTFQIEDGEELAKAIRKVYRVGGHDRVDVALKMAVEANAELPDYKRGQLDEVLKLLSLSSKDRRDIEDAPSLQNVGLRGEDTVTVDEEDRM